MEGMKHCGWVAVNKSAELAGSIISETRQDAEATADEWNRDVTSRYPEYGPYRVVELFYKDDQP